MSDQKTNETFTDNTSTPYRDEDNQTIMKAITDTKESIGETLDRLGRHFLIPFTI